MFVHNATPFRAALKRAAIERPERPIGENPFQHPGKATLERVFATVAVHERYRLDRERLVPEVGALPPALEAALEAPLTNGTSVTAAGSVDGSTRSVLARRVRLAVGEDAVELVCRGPRQWRRSGDRLVPTEPTPFEPFELDWRHAFGGAMHFPPGRDPNSGLPHPGGELPHPMNPRGVGYAPYGLAREGLDLPRIELLHDQLVKPEDSPIPGGFSPCSDLPNLRWRNPFDPRTRLERSSHESPFFIHQPAPFYLVYDALRPGVPIRLSGLRGGERSFAIPALRVCVRWDVPATASQTGVRIRAVHVEAEDATVHLILQHTITTSHRLPKAAIVEEV